MAATAAATTHVYLTGSYDDTLRILSVPDGVTVRQPRVLHEVGLGGGVWRMKVLEDSTSRKRESEEEGDEEDDGKGTWEYHAMLLVSCMYAGAKVVEIRGEAEIVNEELKGGALEWTWTSREVGRTEEHESMCYACDVQPEDDTEDGQEGRAEGEGDCQGRGERIVVSCSFYDKRLCLWKWSGVGS